MIVATYPGLVEPGDMIAVDKRRKPEAVVGTVKVGEHIALRFSHNRVHILKRDGTVWHDVGGTDDGPERLCRMFLIGSLPMDDRRDVCGP